ncbi:hypothetical protein VUR80DRAFT_6170 [Thermomyces stellatus]
MFKSLSRSKSLKSLRARSGGDRPAADDQDVPPPARHGPESPVLGQDMPGPVSDAPQTPTKQHASPTHITGSSPSSHLSSSPPSDNDGAHAYVSRPLPKPPARSPARLAARQSPAERPSTSAGPGTGSSKMFAEPRSQPPPSAAGRRMSKDDLYLSTHSSRSFRSYHIPIRGQLPSPTGSPRSKSPDRTVAVRTQTPDSIAGSNPAAPIGMAIGSPSFAPPVQPPASSGNWQPQLPEMDVKPPWEEPPEPAPAKKPSKWRLFGLLGSKKEPKDRQSPTLDLASTPMTESRPKTASSMRNPEDMGRSNTTTVKKAKKVAPLVVRANTEPAVETPSASMPKEPKTPKTPKTPKAPKPDSIARKASTKSLREGIKKSDISGPMPASAPPMPVSAPPMPPMPTPGKRGFLDVDIPDVKMERYSVMFNGILQPNGGQAPKNSRNSVLLKRQATLRRLQSIQDAIMEEERAKGGSMPSRAHSPPSTRDAPPADTKDTTSAADNSDTRTVTVTAPPLSSHQTHTKSPSFSLFPATPATSSSRGRANTTSRSATPASAVSSPTKTKFELMDPPGRAPIAPPPPIRSDTPESRTRSQMSQKSQDIPIVLDGEERGRGFSPLAQQPVDMGKGEQSGYRRGRSRSSSRSTQLSERTLQAHEASQTRQASDYERVMKPAPLNISKGPQQQPQSRSRSDSRTRIPQPIQTSQQHQRPQYHFRQDQSALVLDSPTDTTTGTIHRTAPSEPVWQMMSPPSSSISSGSTSASSRKRSPSSASSTYTQGSNYAVTAGTYALATSHATTASVDEGEAGKNPVEVSIARQISISRQQRSLLQQPGSRAKPLMRADFTPTGVGSARVRKVGADGERIGGTRMARPTYMRGGSPEVNRKSERIVVEGL